MLDDTAYDGKVPEPLEHITAEHNPGRIAYVSQFIQEENLTDSGLMIVPCLQEKSSFANQDQVRNKKLKEHGCNSTGGQKERGEIGVIGKNAVYGL